jgi:hypothetical protein
LKKERAVIIVKAAAGLVIEFGVGESGRWDALSLRLSRGGSSRSFRFHVDEDGNGRLAARPLETYDPEALAEARQVLADHEALILAEVRKYSWVR